MPGTIDRLRVFASVTGDDGPASAYASYMDANGFLPSGRPPVAFIDDDHELAYVMTRYRQVCVCVCVCSVCRIGCVLLPWQAHDYWHALTGLPRTVLGELALKWFEWHALVRTRIDT